MKHSVLVTGGAGYVGSHMVKMLEEADYDVVVFDNLSRGHRDAASGRFVQGDLLNVADLKSLFEEFAFDAVLHFASLCYVGESVCNPHLYYKNNVVGSLNLFAAMIDSGIDKLVFSSSCAVYGIPTHVPITEDHPKNPISPYGRTKGIIEDILADYSRVYKLKSAALRYFNAAGCDPNGSLGERHVPETHLIPLALQEALRIRSGGDPAATRLEVYGDDHATPDGTCIRDYVHVTDLCSAHVSALKRLLDGKVHCFEAYNLGNGTGFSVKAVIEACRKITGVDILYRVSERRPGDPSMLVADAGKAESVLEWSPVITGLEEMIDSAWHWMLRQVQSPES